MEYLLGDAIFVAGHHSIPMYRKAKGQSTLRGKRAYFNIRAAPMRVGVEHSIGILKGRFAGLRGLGLRLRSRRDQARAHGMVIAAVILHNLLVDAEAQPLTNDIDEMDDLAAQTQRDALPLVVRRGTQGDERRREILVEQMLAIEPEDLDDLDSWELV